MHIKSNQKEFTWPTRKETNSDDWYRFCIWGSDAIVLCDLWHKLLFWITRHYFRVGKSNHELRVVMLVTFFLLGMEKKVYSALFKKESATGNAELMFVAY